MITLFNIDCMEYMATVPDKYFDLAITSPPYNLGNIHHTGKKRHNPYPDALVESDYQYWQINVLNELFRIIKDGGSLFYNHKNRIKDGFSITPYEWILKSEWSVKQELVWFNGSQNFDKRRFYPMTERIYWLTKGMEDKGFANNINHHDLFNWQAEGIDKKHTRTFPEKMVSDILKCFPSGLNIIDPFCGSGTLAIVCDRMNNEFVGCEIDKEYFEAAVKRFENHKRQTTIKF